MDENNVNPVDAGQENVVDSQPQISTEQVETTVNEPVNAESEGVATPQTEEKPVQSAEDNAKYAAIRRQAEAEAKAQVEKLQKNLDYALKYSNLGVRNEEELKEKYGDQGINSWEDVDLYYESQKKGTNYEYDKRLRDMEQTVKSAAEKEAEYQRKLSLIDEDKSLRNDETFGEYYNEHTKEINEIANTHKVSLETALLLTLKTNFKTIVQGAAKKAQQETVNNIIKNGTTTPGSVTGVGGNPTNDYASMSKDDFKALQEKALRGELRKS